MDRVKQLLGKKVNLPVVGPVPVVALIAVIIVLIVVIIAVVGGDDNVDSDPPTDPCNVASDRPNDCDCTGNGHCASSNCIYKKCVAVFERQLLTKEQLAICVPNGTEVVGRSASGIGIITASTPSGDICKHTIHFPQDDRHKDYHQQLNGLDFNVQTR